MNSPSAKPPPNQPSLRQRLESAFQLFQSGQAAAAGAVCEEILAQAPEDFDALHLLGVVHSQEGRCELGVSYLDQALRINPGNSEARANLRAAVDRWNRERVRAAMAMHQRGDLSGAEQTYRAVLQRDAEDFDALQLLGAIATQTQRPMLALDYLDRAIKIKPGFAEAHCNRGNALAALGRLREALESFDRALELKPDFADAHCNRGRVLKNLARFDDALASYDRAIASKPDFAEAYWNKSLLKLLLGDFDAGWRDYEWRWKKKDRHDPPRSYAQPLWTGTADLRGKRILIYAEQGFGDTIQFSRFVPQLALRGAQVILEAPAALRPLLEPLQGISAFIAMGESPPAFDFHCPLLSLPLAFGTTLASIPGAPYLTAPKSRVATWRKTLGRTERPRVGLAWSGNRRHKDDRKRSLPLSDFRRALVRSIDAVCLQKDIREADRTWLTQEPAIRTFDSRLSDFADTAALIENLDLVITVDTGVAHLAGALGKEVWILLPFVPDWRWMLDRSDSPWYDSAKLFRQPAPGDWDSVLREVRQQLAARFGLDPDPLEFEATATAARASDIGHREQLQEAVVLHRAGNLSGAEKIYREILDQDPDNADALQLLGTLAAQRGNPSLALGYLDRALALNPDHFEAHNTRGNALKAQNRLDEALASFDRALVLNPNYAEAHNNRANVLKALNRLEDASAGYDRALTLKPDYHEAHYNRGNTLRALDRTDEALASYDRALALKPGYAEAIINRGNALQAQNRLPEALAAYDEVLALKPAYAEAHNNRGYTLQALKRPAEALACYERSIELKPDYAPAHNNRGNALRALGRIGEALACFDRAIALKPDYPEAHNNRGHALQSMHRIDEAIASFELAISLKPDFAEAHNNRGIALRALDRPEEALASFEQARACNPGLAEIYNNQGVVLADIGRLEAALASFEVALALDPQYAEAHWNEACIHLANGDFETGWSKYEWRWKQTDPAFRPRPFPQTPWLGDADIRGKRVFLHAEQGLGDYIQFCRYAEQVAALGAQVILEIPPPLGSLPRQIKGVAAFVTNGDALPDFDFHCPLLSLPLALKLNLATISGAPYLCAPEDRVHAWRGVLGEASQPRIGVVWSGHPDHRNDRKRSIPLSRFRAALPPGVIPVSLQKDIREADRTWLTQEPAIRTFDSRLADFADTAALIENLDLVITVDTSVAHLAGALGKEVWILLPFVPDWRWMLDRSDSPWYDSARLFRQPAPGDWDSVLREVRQQLAARFGLDPDPRDIDAGDVAPRRPTAAPTIPMTSPVADGQNPELRRRREAIAARRTDIDRWADPRQLSAAWEMRAAIAAKYLPAGARVLDMGCGAMNLEKHLPSGCLYLPCDIVARDERTAICDLNSGELPQDLVARCDVVTMLGVLEYIFDVPALLARLKASRRPLLVSYCPSDNGLPTPRQDLGWVNNYSLEEFSSLLREAGFRIRHRDRIDNVQWLFKAEIDEPPKPRATKKVLVLSYNNVGNFGDRLGYHLLNSILPPHAEASYCHFKPWDVPAEDFDLLVLGIGNSLFAPLLTDGLLQLIDRVPHSLGIFGTQYRAGFPAARLRGLVARLDHWFARYEEDILLYGRESANASHLGDWLIHACPMTRPTLAETLRIGNEVWQDQPLDRSIQRFQQYRRVYSTRLHPLLCALTSAEEVAYEEQRESGGEPSGKFRSLLLDIFGREFPEKQFWSVDRTAVLTYKQRVAGNIAGLKARIDALLA